MESCGELKALLLLLLIGALSAAFSMRRIVGLFRHLKGESSPAAAAATTTTTTTSMECDDKGCATPAGWQKPGAKLPVMGDEAIMSAKVS